MNVLIVGASGATGRLLVEQLLERDIEVRAIVRSADRLPEKLRRNPNLTVTEAAVLELSDEELTEQVRGCHAVASCLGHNLSFKGVLGPPRRLVTDAVRRLCAAANAGAPETPVKFVLMNTAGNQNRDLDEPISFGQKCVLGLLRALVPPHVDNEEAADWLRTKINQPDSKIAWCAVRPDTLIDATDVSDYDAFPSPTRSAIFNPGKTSRINVAHFMAELIADDSLWEKWKGQMPVIYNREESNHGK